MKKTELIQQVALACDDKGAENIIVLDMKEVSLVADYFLICHANNERLVQAISRAVRDSLEDTELPVLRTEGFDQGRWIVVDAGDIVCHVFHQEERQFYNLERLWGDAKHLPLRIGQEG